MPLALLIGVLNTNGNHLRAHLQSSFASRGLEQEAPSIDGSGRGADLRHVWRVADDNAPVGETRFSVAEALSEACVNEDLAQAFCGVMLATKCETCVSLDLVQNMDWRDDACS